MSAAHLTADLVRAILAEKATELETVNRQMRDATERADYAERANAKLRADLDAIAEKASEHAASMVALVAEMQGAPDPIAASHSSLRLALIDAKRAIAALTAERDELLVRLEQRDAA